MSALLEVLMELICGATGLLILHLVGKRGLSRSDTACMVVGLLFWLVVAALVGLGIWWAQREPASLSWFSSQAAIAMRSTARFVAEQASKYA